MDDTEAIAAAPISLSPEHSWEAAAPILFPILRPAGTIGLRLDTVATPHDAAGNVEPLVDDGPAGLVISYVMTAGGFGVLANGDHLAAWGATPAMLRDAAFRNLGAWSLGAPWSDDAADRRRVLSSDTGDGWDASRILLPDVQAHLERELGGGASRVLVGVPAAHLLIAASLRPEDPEFAGLFADFVLEYAGDSDAEIDRRVFELRDGRLTVFDPAAT
jgi:uncharacterized protein YtpQ (UPF0354 family)